MTSSWGSINLLEWLIELRKTRLLTRLPINYKRILKVTKQQPDREIHMATSQTKEILSSWSLGPGMVALGSVLVPSWGNFLKRAIKLSFWGFVEASLHSHD